MQKIRGVLESRQIIIYFVTMVAAMLLGLLIRGTTALKVAINPSLALMLFVTFLQVPLADLKCAFTKLRFLGALLVANFVVVPLFVMVLVQILPSNPMVRIGVLLVLLTPCIDYVVTFTHLGRGNAPLLLAATPILLILQMLLLPIYLSLFLGENAAHLVKITPFIHAFIELIIIPLLLAAFMQLWAVRSLVGKKISTMLGLVPVPATALVLFVVIAAVVPQLELAINAVLRVTLIYIAFAIIAPLIGWFVARIFRLDTVSGRSVAFSASTRNSLVVLPLAFSIPGALPVLPAIIVTQTLVELMSELVYVRLFPKFMK